MDEIAHLPLDAQAKLLRVIEQREFERLSVVAKRSQSMRRLIALTNADLKTLSSAARFATICFIGERVHIRCRRARTAEGFRATARLFAGTYAPKARHPRDEDFAGTRDI